MTQLKSNKNTQLHYPLLLDSSNRESVYRPAYVESRTFLVALAVPM